MARVQLRTRIARVVVAVAPVRKSGRLSVLLRGITEMSKAEGC